MLLLLAVSCSSYSRIERIASGDLSMGFSVPTDEPDDNDSDLLVDSIRGTLSDGPVILNAVKDDETGEMVATDVITASKVTARFRNVAERAGKVTISFDISVPSAMSDSRWKLKISPNMYVQSDTVPLEPVFITGSAYREAQLRGYERYKAFLDGIITDTTDLMWLRQLEIFLERHSESLFGVGREEAMEHYKRHMRIRMNESRIARTDEMFSRYVKDPIVSEGVRLDTVLVGEDGGFVYRYAQTFRSRPALRKVHVVLTGSLYEWGRKLLELPMSDELTYYISTLASLTDDRPRTDTMYMKGIQALKDLDYKTAVTILRPYDDYNSALALVTADYNHTALDVLGRQDGTDAKVCYLKAMVLSRLGEMDEAMKYFKLALAYDPYLEHRANLDPEMYELINKYKPFKNN